MRTIKYPISKPPTPNVNVEFQADTESSLYGIGCNTTIFISYHFVYIHVQKLGALNQSNWTLFVVIYLNMCIYTNDMADKSNLSTV